ncbi:diaminopimelate decarboxylase family protein [Gloeothece verrucosa]|uniref:Diaminopimelate decarboxylase n=1 Tax=Gloeothece verrucosa (strain PCC 7822) TaxID=497965 RepID=E0UMT8_GLOV7|nr:decarboxylase [Gloeothece verrucosa]ADN18268.1 Diaminopimelate decarboxylase [Gloeothece verrucosa PCC 7822]
MVINEDFSLHKTKTVSFSLEVAQELLKIYHSPLYLYQGEVLRQEISHITRSIPYHNTRFQFATVTNGNIALLKIFKELGWGLHANTPGDIYLGLKAGFKSDNIVYSGSNLNRQEIEQLFNWNIKILNLDSVSQLQLCCQIYEELKGKLTPPKLGFRLNLPELTGESRIGIRPEEFPQALYIAQSAGLKIQGLHFYRGTGTNATKAFTGVIETLIKTCQLLPDWNYLDFGGGFGYRYQHQGIQFDWGIFGEALTEALNKLNRKIELIIEPGRAVIAACGTLLAQVVSVKWQENKQIIGVDTTVANLSVPSVHGGYREIVTWKENTEQLYLTDVCGNTTYSRDYLGKNCQLPALEIGDMIGILDVGAYGYAMSSHFLHRPRAAEVLLEGKTHKLIRRREDYSILLNNQVLT